MNTKRGTANATCLFMLILALTTALFPCKAFADEALGDVDTPQAPKLPIPRLLPLKTENRLKLAYRKMQPAHRLRAPPTQSAISHVPKKGRIELSMERITVTRI